MKRKVKVDPREDTYKDVQLWLRKLSVDWHHTYGGDPDELFSEANIVFMRVYEKYDPSKGSLTNLLRTSVQNHFRDLAKREGRRSGIRGCDCGMDHLTYVDEDSVVDYQLSVDGEFVLGLILRPPRKVRRRAEERGGKPSNWRSAVKRHLKDLGWTVEEAAKSFAEIREMFR